MLIKLNEASLKAIASSILASLVLANTANANPELVESFRYGGQETNFRKDGAIYRSKSGRSIDRTAIRKLVKEIKSSVVSAAERDLSVQNLGISPASVGVHDREIREACSSYIPCISTKAINNLDLSYESVCLHAKNLLSEHWTHHDAYSLVISDPSICATEIEITSEGQAPYLLPWKVKIGKKEYHTYSTRIPVAVSAILKPTGYCSEEMDGSNYWTNEFWHDKNFWSRELGSKLGDESGRELAESLKGYDALGNQFEISKTTIGQVVPFPLSLCIDLKPKTRSVINSIEWFNMLKDNKPTSNWNEMYSAYRHCEDLVEERPWLSSWKSAEEGRKVWCTIAGKALMRADEFDLQNFVMPAWKHSGLKGEPEISLSLSRPDQGIAKLYLSSEDKRTLVEYAYDINGPHWFGHHEVSFHPSKPYYVIVKPDGTFEWRAMDYGSIQKETNKKQIESSKLLLQR